MNVPGPGAYTHRTKPGHYVVSTIPNTGSPVMRPTKIGRFHQTTYFNKTPGPDKYLLKDSVTSGGSKYVLSTNKNLGGGAFGRKLKDYSLKQKRFIPGPGTYEAASDFGSLYVMDIKNGKN
jgi:hypothetical protein